jgi:NADH dehydrogenase [ubiquinone] 1 alpha subcomplex assembly factor 6
MDKGQKISYVGQLVRDNDLDRFFLSMFAPAAVRENLWALFAFNHEIAKTREVVSETQLGLIRLQWWREAIAGVYGGQDVPEHEVLKPLSVAIKAHDLPKALFETLVYAREFDLEDVLPGNVEGLVNYADFTATPLMKLAAIICGDRAQAEPVQAVAVNYALCGLMRAIPFHAQQRRCYLPEDLMQRHDVRQSWLYEFKVQAGLPPVVERVMGEFVADVKPQSRFLKAAQALAGLYARQIRAAGYDPLSPKMQGDPPFKALRVACAAMFP